MFLYRIQQRLDSVLHRKHVIGFSNSICLKGHYVVLEKQFKPSIYVVLENTFKNLNFIIYNIS